MSIIMWYHSPHFVLTYATLVQSLAISLFRKIFRRPTTCELYKIRKNAEIMNVVCMLFKSPHWFLKIFSPVIILDPFPQSDFSYCMYLYIATTYIKRQGVERSNALYGVYMLT
mgnify:CR=1 FL=1